MNDISQISHEKNVTQNVNSQNENDRNKEDVKECQECQGSSSSLSYESLHKPSKHPKYPLSQEQLQQIQQAILSAIPYGKIAKDFSISREKVRYIAKKMGIKRERNKVNREALKKLFHQGLSDEEIAKTLSCSPITVKLYRQKLGLVRRLRKKRKIIKQIDGIVFSVPPNYEEVLSKINELIEEYNYLKMRKRELLNDFNYYNFRDFIIKEIEETLSFLSKKIEKMRYYLCVRTTVVQVI